MASMEGDWCDAVSKFTADVLNGRSLPSTDKFEVFDRAIELVRNNCLDASRFDEKGISSSFDCIRLTIRRGRYSIANYTGDSSRSSARSDVCVLIDELLECGLSILRGSKTAGNIIAVERFFLALFGMSAAPLATVAARGGLDILVTLMSPQPTATASSSSMYAKPLSVLYNTIRVFHFLEIRYSNVLASHCATSPIDLFRCALDLLRTGLGYGNPASDAALPLPVAASRSQMILEVLRYCYAALSNHGDKLFVAEFANRTDASSTCSRSVSFWTTPFRGGGANDESAICAIIQYTLCSLPTRHRKVYDYQLQCLQLLMMMPLPLAVRVFSGAGGVQPLLHLLRTQLQVVWDLDTDAGLAQRDYIAGEKVDQNVATTLVMGYHSEKATVMLMPVFAVLINLCNYSEQSAQYRDPSCGLPSLDLVVCRAIKSSIRVHVLGEGDFDSPAALGSAFVAHRSTDGSSASALREKLVLLMTSLNTYLKRSSGELLYTLCENDEKEFVKWTGYGNAIGLLQSKKGMLEGLQS